MVLFFVIKKTKQTALDEEVNNKTDFWVILF